MAQFERFYPRVEQGIRSDAIECASAQLEKEIGTDSIQLAAPGSRMGAIVSQIL